MTSSELFKRVCRLVRSWEPAADSPDHVPRDLQTYLHSSLAARYEDRQIPITPHPDSRYCDFMVGDQIAIKLYFQFSVASARQLRLLAWRGDIQYDHLIVLGYNLPGTHSDSWRLAASRLSADGTTISEIAFIRQTPRPALPENSGHGLLAYLEPVVVIPLLIGAGIIFFITEPHLELFPYTLSLTTTAVFALVLLYSYGLFRAAHL